MKILSAFLAGSFAFVSAADAKCLWDCPEFKFGVEATITVTDGETTQETTAYGLGTIPLSTLLDGGKGEIVLGLSKPLDFAHPLLGTEKISAVVGFTYFPSEHFTPATAVAIVPLKDLGDTLTPNGARYRLYVPMPRTKWLPDPFFETDGRSFGGGLSMGFSLDGARVTGRYALFNSIPEPATWSLLISGFGLVGIAMRHRSKAVAEPA